MQHKSKFHFAYLISYIATEMDIDIDVVLSSVPNSYCMFCHNVAMIVFCKLIVEARVEVSKSVSIIY